MATFIEMTAKLVAKPRFYSLRRTLSLSKRVIRQKLCAHTQEQPGERCVLEINCIQTILNCYLGYKTLVVPLLTLSIVVNPEPDPPPATGAGKTGRNHAQDQAHMCRTQRKENERKGKESNGAEATKVRETCLKLVELIGVDFCASK